MTPIAYLTYNPDGDPSMLFFDDAEAIDFCDDGEKPEPLVLASNVRDVLHRIVEEIQFGSKRAAVDIANQALKDLS